MVSSDPYPLPYTRVKKLKKNNPGKIKNQNNTNSNISDKKTTMFLGCLWSGDMELYFYDDQIGFVLQAATVYVQSLVDFLQL